MHRKFKTRLKTEYRPWFKWKQIYFRCREKNVLFWLHGHGFYIHTYSAAWDGFIIEACKVFSAKRGACNPLMELSLKIELWGFHPTVTICTRACHDVVSRDHSLPDVPQQGKGSGEGSSTVWQLESVQCKERTLACTLRDSIWGEKKCVIVTVYAYLVVPTGRC